MSLSSEQLKLLSLCKIKDASWYVIAREAQRPGGVGRLFTGRIIETSPEAIKTRDAIKAAAGNMAQHLREVRTEYEKASEVGARLVTIVDPDYPATLRLIFNPPPFLFIRGTLTDTDLRSVAVVGTRKASTAGLRRAARMAQLLAGRGVTVVSGLARGVDTAAHQAALAVGGRTVAVIGTGIRRCYPAENRELAEQIATAGAIVSQFWPDTPPRTDTFPRRNVTMSGIAQGTVVIEASKTSGAKLQARLALEHDKRVFLIKSLTEQQPWARSYVETRGATLVESVDDVVRHLATPDRVRAAEGRRSELAQAVLFD